MNAGIRMTDVVIPDSLHGRRLDQALADLTGLSRSRIRTLLDEAHILKNGRSCKGADRASAGEAYSIDLPPAAPPSPTPSSASLPPLSVPSAASAARGAAHWK